MKKILSLITLLTIMTACGGKKGNTTTATADSFSFDNSKTTVLYFHSNHRCATCMAVENVTKETIDENFSGTVAFYSLDINEAQNKDVMKQYSIGGQTLLIVKGDKSSNMTSNAFMFARNKPEKVKSELIATIESYQ